MIQQQQSQQQQTQAKVVNLEDALAQACYWLNSNYVSSSGVMSQVWLPKEDKSKNEMILHTQNLPYAINARHDLLALFRCVSCRYNFSTDVQKAERLGCIGRVFTQKIPEMCASVQIYQPRIYLRVEEAQKCNVNSTVVVPVFQSQDRNQMPAAVFEVLHVDACQSFVECLSALQRALEQQNLFTCNFSSIKLQPGLRELDFSWTNVQGGRNLKITSRFEPKKQKQPAQRNVYIVEDGIKKEVVSKHIEDSSSSCSPNDNDVASNPPPNINITTNINDVTTISTNNKQNNNNQQLQLGNNIVSFDEDIGEAILTDEDDEDDDEDDDDIIFGDDVERDVEETAKNQHLAQQISQIPQIVQSTQIQSQQQLQQPHQQQQQSHFQLIQHHQNQQSCHVNDTQRNIQMLGNLGIQFNAQQQQQYPFINQVIYPQYQSNSFVPQSLPHALSSHSFLHQLQNNDQQQQQQIQDQQQIYSAPHQLQLMQDYKKSQAKLYQQQVKKEVEKVDKEGVKQMSYGRRLTYDDLVQHFGMGLKDAASALGVCTTTLKRACRRYGIKKWPRRQLQRLSKALNSMHGLGLDDPLKFLKDKTEAQKNSIARNVRKKIAKNKQKQSVQANFECISNGQQQLEGEAGPPQEKVVLNQQNIQNNVNFSITQQQMEQGDWQNSIGFGHGGQGGVPADFLSFLEHPQDLSSLLRDVEGGDYVGAEGDGISSMHNLH